MKSTTVFFALSLFLAPPLLAQSAYLLGPDRVFDGETVHAGWAVLDQMSGRGFVNL